MSDLLKIEFPAPSQAIVGHVVALCYVPSYRHARRGLCRLLVDGLSSWKARSHSRRLVTMFQEVYAIDSIWRSPVVVGFAF